MQEAQKQQQRFLASLQLLAVLVEQPQGSLPLLACLDSDFLAVALVAVAVLTSRQSLAWLALLAAHLAVVVVVALLPTTPLPLVLVVLVVLA